MPEGSLALLGFPLTLQHLQGQVSAWFSSTPANGEENPTPCSLGVASHEVISHN